MSATTEKKAETIEAQTMPKNSSFSLIARLADKMHAPIVLGQARGVDINVGWTAEKPLGRKSLLQKQACGMAVAVAAVVAGVMVVVAAVVGFGSTGGCGGGVS